MTLTRTARLAGIAAYLGVAFGVPLLVAVVSSFRMPPHRPDGMFIAGGLWLALAVAPHLVTVAALLPGRDRAGPAAFIRAEAACGALTLLALLVCAFVRDVIAWITGSANPAMWVAVVLLPTAVVVATRVAYAHWLPRPPVPGHVARAAS